MSGRTLKEQMQMVNALDLESYSSKRSWKVPAPEPSSRFLATIHGRNRAIKLAREKEEKEKEKAEKEKTEKEQEMEVDATGSNM